MKHSSSPVVTFVAKQESQVLELTASPFLDIDLVKNIHNDQNKGDDGTVTTTSDKSTPLFEQLSTVLVRMCDKE